MPSARSIPLSEPLRLPRMHELKRGCSQNAYPLPETRSPPPPSHPPRSLSLPFPPSLLGAMPGDWSSTGGDEAVASKLSATRPSASSCAWRLCHTRHCWCACLLGGCGHCLEYVSLCQQTSAYVSIRQHTSACVPVRRVQTLRRGMVSVAAWRRVCVARCLLVHLLGSFLLLGIFLHMPRSMCKSPNETHEIYDDEHIQGI